MHEASIMQEALAQAEAQARQHGCAAIHVLRLRVGALSGVVPEALEFAFEALKAGTLAAGATLEIERVEARAYCAHCRREFTLEDAVFPCPDCGGWESELRQGRELDLVRLEAS
ncbi:MAG: hydrogenase maturation nickel metallochaperone HypA [Verrucomicrobia bacterium]|nr:hydrogenase maturation nickel metallochaperone HypA [Verrucomicrobiota bacterium]